MNTSILRSFKKKKTDDIDDNKKKPILKKLQNDTRNLHLYIKAICCKKNRRYNEASELYYEHIKSHRMSINKQLYMTMFSILMLPNANDRRTNLNVLENLMDHLNLLK